VKKSEMTQIQKKADVVKLILPNQLFVYPKHKKGLGFAPTNIALCKYWGKRHSELNIPITSSLSVALPEKGAMTTLTLHEHTKDIIVLNGTVIPEDSDFSHRLVRFLDLFRGTTTPWHLHIDINMNIPVAAGLASSACGFASLVSALNDLFDWELSLRDLSILSRLGSGSAARSLWSGFVEWHAGVQSDGMDSYGEPLSYEWPEMCIGILAISEEQKPISSRDAMQRTINSSSLYSCWPKKVAQDLAIIKQALQVKNFSLLGGTAESNALTMHATMLSSWPPICYFLPATLKAMQEVWSLRREGLELFFTEDAGPNLKLLFQVKDQGYVKDHFPSVEVVKLFN
jgi:diphosphomevalonate decarboxylase